MYLAKVVGMVVSTFKHPSYRDQKLMIVRLTTPEGDPTGKSMVAIDSVEAGVGDWVLVASEGLTVSEELGHDGLLPIREIIIGIVDRVDT
ncbi:MAG: EutN/CcmL family microcompartment protein [Acidobacteriota bacterium]